MDDDIILFTGASFTWVIYSNVCVAHLIGMIMSRTQITAPTVDILLQHSQTTQVLASDVNCGCHGYWAHVRTGLVSASYRFLIIHKVLREQFTKAQEQFRHYHGWGSSLLAITWFLQCHSAQPYVRELLLTLSVMAINFSGVPNLSAMHKVLTLLVFYESEFPCSKYVLQRAS